MPLCIFLVNYPSVDLSFKTFPDCDLTETITHGRSAFQDTLCKLSVISDSQIKSYAR